MSRYKHQQKKILGYFEVDVNDKDGKQLYDITDWDTYRAICMSNDIVVEHSPPLDIDLKNVDLNHDFIYVPLKESQIKWNIRQRNVHTCLPRAASDYMSHWFGMSLDNDDTEWFKQYGEKVTSDGCTQAWTMTVISQLLEPYGLGVSRVVVDPSIMQHGEHLTWMGRLGANPFFAAGQNTTNDEALDQMAVTDPAQREFWKNQWRFETHLKPKGPFISLETWGGGSTVYSDNKLAGYSESSWGNYSPGAWQGGGSMGGHNGGAHYRGPRALIKNFKIAVQLDRIENIDTSRYEKFPLSPYEIDKGIRSPNFGSVLCHKEAGKGGKSISIKAMESHIKYTRNTKNRTKDAKEIKARKEAWMSYRGISGSTTPLGNLGAPTSITYPSNFHRSAPNATFNGVSGVTGSQHNQRPQVKLDFPPVCKDCQQNLIVRELTPGDNRCSGCNARVQRDWANPPAIHYPLT